MKLAITLMAPDMYTDELRYLKSYPLTYPEHILEIVHYHKQSLGNSSCHIKIMEFDTDTMQVVNVHEYSCPVKKKIIINKDVTSQTTAKKPKYMQANINDVLHVLQSSYTVSPGETLNSNMSFNPSSIGLGTI